MCFKIKSKQQIRHGFVIIHTVKMQLFLRATRRTLFSSTRPRYTAKKDAQNLPITQQSGNLPTAAATEKQASLVRSQYNTQLSTSNSREYAFTDASMARAYRKHVVLKNAIFGMGLFFFSIAVCKYPLSDELITNQFIL